MATNTKIEWADKTWSPLIGCDRVSPGCHRCYAITTAHIRTSNPNPKISTAFAGTTHRINGRTDWTGQINQLENRLNQPLSWRKPAKVFVNSQSDLFHKDVDHDFIVKIFAIMALTPQHTYQILTKRHGRMKTVLNDLCTCGNGCAPGVHFRSAMAWAVSQTNPNRIPGLPDDAEKRVYDAPWPLRNVHMGVSVEDQQWADIRIPALLNTPAAVRFLSAEPLLGPIDLSAWIGALNGDEASGERRVLGGPVGGAADRQSGAGLEGRSPTERQMEGRDQDHSVHTTPGGSQNRGLHAGSRDEERDSVSRTGTPVGMETLRGPDTGRPDRESQERREDGQPAGKPGTGYVLRTGDSRTARAATRPSGSARRTELDGEADFSTGGGDQEPQNQGGVAEVDRGGLPGRHAAHLSDSPRRPTISWVICGGESGAGARPMHPDWARTLRDQCKAANVPFLFKQWGQWGPMWPLDEDGHLIPGKRGLGIALANDGTIYQPGELDYPNGPRWGEALRADHGKAHLTAMYSLGKKEAGRELDGRTWDQYPEPR